MSRFDRPMDNPINWSFPVGRLFGIKIRVHVAFVLAAVIMVLLELPTDDVEARVPFGRLLVYTVGTYALLFGIVLTHEFGHCLGARFTGGDADEILLWPLGGLAFVNPPHNPSAHMITTLAGPMVNVIFCAISSMVLVLWIGSLGAVPWNPLHPTWPVDSSIFPTTGQEWVMRFFGLNYILLLFNLVPVFPLDGGRVVQAWMWGKKGYEPSMLIATATGMVGSILLGLFGLFTESSWLLLAIAVLGYLTCYQMRRQIRETAMFGGDTFGYDFSQGYASLESEPGQGQRRPGFFERRRARRAAQKAQLQREQRERFERQVEEVLRKVSASGLASLTARERRILDQESARQRALHGGPKDTDKK